MRKPEEYESEIRALKAEIERLRGGAAAMTMAGARPVASGAPAFTMSGLEEMVLVIGAKGEVAYWNDRMARLMGASAEERKSLVGRPLAEAGRGPAAEVVATLALAARDSGQAFVVEREIPELQGTAPEWQKRPPLMRFSCTAAEGKVQIVAQDVTHAKWLEKNFSRYVSQHVISQMGEMSEEELLRTRKLFEDLTGKTMSGWWRAPYGEQNEEIRQWAEEIGFRHVDWTRTPVNCDMLDWIADPRHQRYFNAEAMYQRFLSIDGGRRGGAGGAIILMHLGTDRKDDFMDEILPRAIDSLRERGYEFTSVTHLFAQ